MAKSIAVGTLRRLKLIGVASVMTALLVGCVSESPLTGDWIGRRDLKFADPSNIAVNATLARVTWQVYPNGRFRLTYGSVPMEGRSEFSGDSGRLIVEKVVDRNVTGSEAPVIEVRRVDGRFELKIEGEWVRMNPRATETKTIPQPPQ